MESDKLIITWQIWHLTEPLIDWIENCNFSVTVVCGTYYNCSYNEIFHLVVPYINCRNIFWSQWLYSNL